MICVAASSLDCFCAGKVIDLVRSTSDGFAQGHLQVQGGQAWQGQTCRVDFQNENLLATCGDGSVLACVPDLICCLDSGVAIAMRMGPLQCFKLPITHQSSMASMHSVLRHCWELGTAAVHRSLL